MDESVFNMSVDEMSFYNDDTTHLLQSKQLDCFTVNTPFGSLSTHEESMQLFHIVNESINTNIQISQTFVQKPKEPTCTNNDVVNTLNSPKTFNSVLSENMDASMDDDYMDLFEMEALEQQNESNFNFPTDLNTLICGKINESSPRRSIPKTPEIRRPSVRRCLEMIDDELTSSNIYFSDCLSNIQQMDYKTNQKSPCFKRPDPPSLHNSPIQTKRFRQCETENLGESCMRQLSFATSKITTINTPSGQVLRKCMSMNDADIMSALARSENNNEPELIGDFSKPYILPLLKGKHSDLKYISSDTLASVINGEYNDKIESFQIIDCRYPYEYDGGHIRGAINSYTQEKIIKEFLAKKKTVKEDETQLTNIEIINKKRKILVFHCEFSSERAPKLLRFLRSNDRIRNTNSYPALDYPEIYLLHNGYKEFYKTHSELCNPAAYRPMLEPSYNEEYRHFRAKSKSWNGVDGFDGISTKTLVTLRKDFVNQRRTLNYRL